jgi:membrane protein
LALIWIYLTWWVTLAGAVLVANMPMVRAGLLDGKDLNPLASGT